MEAKKVIIIAESLLQKQSQELRLLPTQLSWKQHLAGKAYNVLVKISFKPIQ